MSANTLLLFHFHFNLNVCISEGDFFRRLSIMIVVRVAAAAAVAVGRARSALAYSMRKSVWRILFEFTYVYKQAWQAKKKNSVLRSRFSHLCSDDFVRVKSVIWQRRKLFT